jgi:hypothetical protein
LNQVTRHSDSEGAAAKGVRYLVSDYLLSSIPIESKGPGNKVAVGAIAEPEPASAAAR